MFDSYENSHKFSFRSDKGSCTSRMEVSEVVDSSESLRNSSECEDIGTSCSICNGNILDWDESLESYPACGHSSLFCKTCVSSHIHFKIQENSVRTLKCPFPGCQEFFLREFVIKVASGEDIALYEANRTNLDSVENKKKFVWTIVKNVWVDVNEYCSSILRRSTHDSKRCPRCRFVIEKDGGCSHMTCSRCSHEFHWCCGQSYSRKHSSILCDIYAWVIPLVICVLGAVTVALWVYLLLSRIPWQLIMCAVHMAVDAVAAASTRLAGQVGRTALEHDGATFFIDVITRMAPPVWLLEKVYLAAGGVVALVAALAAGHCLNTSTGETAVLVPLLAVVAFLSQVMVAKIGVASGANLMFGLGDVSIAQSALALFVFFHPSRDLLLVVNSLCAVFLWVGGSGGTSLVWTIPLVGIVLHTLQELLRICNCIRIDLCEPHMRNQHHANRHRAQRRLADRSMRNKNVDVEPLDLSTSSRATAVAALGMCSGAPVHTIAGMCCMTLWVDNRVYLREDVDNVPVAYAVVVLPWLWKMGARIARAVVTEVATKVGKAVPVLLHPSPFTPSPPLEDDTTSTSTSTSTKTLATTSSQVHVGPTPPLLAPALETSWSPAKGVSCLFINAPTADRVWYVCLKVLERIQRWAAWLRVGSARVGPTLNSLIMGVLALSMCPQAACGLLVGTLGLAWTFAWVAWSLLCSLLCAVTSMASELSSGGSGAPLGWLHWGWQEPWLHLLAEMVMAFDLLLEWMDMAEQANEADGALWTRPALGLAMASGWVATLLSPLLRVVLLASLLYSRCIVHPPQRWRRNENEKKKSLVFIHSAHLVLLLVHACNAGLSWTHWLLLCASSSVIVLGSCACYFSFVR